MVHFNYRTLFAVLPLMVTACAAPQVDDPAETQPEVKITGLGTCVHYGDPDAQEPAALNCNEPTGSGWTTESFEEACENEWDAYGIYESEIDACPTNTMTATCDMDNGGNLIGATYEGEAYGGTLYYYPNSRWEDASAHCNSLNGIFASEN